MCSWLSRKPVGLLAWQGEGVVDSALHREAEECTLSLPLGEVMCLWESSFLLPGMGEEISIMFFFFFQSRHVMLKQLCEEVLPVCIWF